MQSVYTNRHGKCKVIFGPAGRMSSAGPVGKILSESENESDSEADSLM